MARTVAIFGMLALASASLGARQEEVSPQVFSEVVDVRVVNVETVVTDAEGNPVRGLDAADFRLLVDGREVPVEYFTEVVEGIAASKAAGEMTAPVGAGESVGRRYLVFIDDSFSVTGIRNEVLTRMQHDLSLMSAADEMAVLAFAEGKIDVLGPWSNDVAALTAALEKAKARPARGHQLLAQHRSMDEDYGVVVEAADAIGLTPEEAAAVMAPLRNRVSPEARTQLGKTAQAAAGALRGFDAPPGRKVLLLLSGAWSLIAGPQLFGPMVDAANRLGYTVYPVDAASSNQRSVRAFDAIARTTGGRVANTGKLDVFREVVADTASYYWLGFTPAWKADGARHQVTVEVRRAGLRTRARGSFADISKPVETAMKAEGALLFGAPEEERKLIVQLGKPRRAGRRQIEVPVTIGVPVSSLALIPDGDGYIAETPLAAATVDEKGGRSELPSSKLRVRVKQVPKGGGYARFQTTVKLRDIEQRVVFTVHDPVNGEVIWGEANVRPQPKQR